MPYKRKYKKRRSYGRKKKYTRKKKRSSTTVQRGVFSKTQVVRLRYCDNFQLNAATDSTVSHVWRANSIFDPDFEIGGHQPMGHDQWLNFYSHYTVIGSRIKVNSQQSSTTTTGAGLVGVLLKDNSTTITSGSTNIMEQALAKWRLYGPMTSGRPVSVTHGFSSKKFFGLKDIADNTDRVGAEFGADPEEVAYFHVFQSSVAAGLDPALIYVNITIDYICLLTEPKALGSS